MKDLRGRQIAISQRLWANEEKIRIKTLTKASKQKDQIFIILAVLHEAFTEDEVHLRGLAPEQHSTEETSQWR